MNIRKSDLLGALGSALAALALLVYWHLRNHGYPTGDNAEYMWGALRIYRHYVTGGILSGLNAAYMVRVWKTVFHPTLAFPALVLTHGSVLRAQALTVIGLYASLSVVVYLLARRYLDALDAFLTTALLLNIPWISANAHAFDVELPSFLYFFGAWTGILWSDCFSKKAPTLIGAFFMGLYFSARPAEAIILFGILGPTFLVFSIRSRQLSTQDVARALVPAAVPILAAYLIAVPYAYRFDWGYTEWDNSHQSLASLEVIMAAAAVGWVTGWLLNRKRKALLWIFLMLGVSIAALWHGPYMRPIYDYLARSSYVMVEGNTMSYRIGYAELYGKLWHQLVGPAVIAIAFLGLIGFRGLLKSQRPGAPRLVGALIVLLLMSFIHVSMAAFSFNNDIRYYYLELGAILFVLLLGFLGSPRLHWIKRGAVFTLFCTSLIAQAHALGLTENFIPWETAFGALTSAPPKTFPDPGIALFNQLLENAPLPDGTKIMVYPTELDYGFTGTLEQLQMRLFALEKGHEIYVRYPAPYLLMDWKKWFTDQGQIYDYYVVGPQEFAKKETLDEIRREHHPWIKTLHLSFEPGGPLYTLLLIKR